jgi:ABC-type transporter lipoprotein component MlaA
LDKTFETRRHEAASADTKDPKKKDTETQRHWNAIAKYEEERMMAKDTMTAEERIVATINFQPVDRVVCAPIIEQYAGITNKEQDRGDNLSPLSRTIKKDYAVLTKMVPVLNRGHLF